MSNSYCGKECNDCLDKEEVGCPGCKDGPGKKPGGLCDIAKCCSARVMETCATCMTNGSCTMLENRENMLQKWNGSRNRETAATVTLMNPEGTESSSYGERRNGRSRDGHNAPLLRKSLIAIFWLFLVGGTGNVLSNENIFGLFPAVVAIGSFINLGAGIAQAILMIRLGWEERAYKVAGVCILIATGLAFFGGGIVGVAGVAVKFSGNATGVIGLIFGVLLVLAALVLQIIGAYQFLVANARVVEYRDGALSDRWIVMSKLLFAVLGGIIVVPILFFVLRMIGVIIGLLYILGVLAFGVCEYVFLYQTANRFRE